MNCRAHFYYQQVYLIWFIIRLRNKLKLSSFERHTEEEMKAREAEDPEQPILISAYGLHELTYEKVHRKPRCPRWHHCPVIMQVSGRVDMDVHTLHAS